MTSLGGTADDNHGSLVRRAGHAAARLNRDCPFPNP
jgi:hypothetical protein